MESRLPRPLQEALQQKEAKSGVRLLSVALGGLVGSIGVAALVAASFGVTLALGIGGVLLVGTALSLLRALGQFEEKPIDREFTDNHLIEALVAMDRRAVVVTDQKGEIKSFNPAFDRLALGRPRFLGDIFRTDEVREAYERTVSRVAQVGHGGGEFALDHAGTQRLSFTGTRTGFHILWRVSHLDDQERLNHEKRQAIDWGEPLFARLGCGVLLENADGKIQYINDVLREWIGLEDAEIPLKIQLKAGETQLLIGKKQRIDVDVIDVPLKSREDERSFGRYRFLRKIDQVRGRLAPADREFLIDPIFDAAPIAVAVVERDGKLREFNQPLTRHPAGRSIKVGDSILDMVKEDDRAELEELIQFANDGKPASSPLDVIYSTHAEHAGQIFSSSLTKGDETFSVLYLLDTTQEKSLERQFVQAQKMQAVGQLAGGVAHDFNNLLTAIIGFCDLLLVRHDAGDQSFSDIIQIKQNANRAANLVRQLLAFSRQQTLRPKVLMMTDVVAELSNLIRRLIGETIELKVVHGRDLQPVKVDQGQLEQVIINLAVNARDAMPGGGRLDIRTSMIGPEDTLIERYDVVVPDDYILVEVEDTGCGIPKENLTKIFEPFFTTKEVGQGTGLGLATAYGIVKQTGGYVFVESEVNKGTTFRLLFRAHAANVEEIEEEEKPQESPGRDLTGKGTILIVEDEDPVRMFASRALANKGYNVLEAASGEAGLEILLESKEPVDLLISDVIMPSMDGPTLVKEARKHMPDLPVIFVSGYAEDVFRQNLEAEEFLFLPKPFSLKDLASHVKSILG